MEAGPCFTVGSKGDLSLRNGACKCPRQAGIPRTTNLKIALEFKTTWSSLLSPDPSRNAKTKCTRTLNPFFFKPVRRRLERKIWSFYGLRRRRWLVAWQANTQQRSNVSAGRQCYRCMMALMAVRMNGGSQREPRSLAFWWPLNLPDPKRRDSHGHFLQTTLLTFRVLNITAHNIFNGTLGRWKVHGDIISWI